MTSFTRPLQWALLAATLGGCAALNQVSSEVSTFGDWPAGRAPGTFAFDRLPSQQARADRQQRLEDAARPALERAGFRAAAPGSEPELLVQLGARVSRAERAPWDDPLWWHGGFGYWRHAGWRGPLWAGPGWRGYGVTGGYYDSPRYDREVALLIRERSSGKPLYEAHASNEGYSRSGDGLIAPMFTAALTGFPAAAGVNPRQVSVPLGSN